MFYQSLPLSLAEIFHIPLLASLIRILRLSCSRCPLWTDGVSRVQRKGWKTSKVSNRNKPQALFQLHKCWESLDLEAEIAVWVCRQKGQLRHHGASPQVVKLINLPTNPEPKGLQRYLVKKKEYTHILCLLRPPLVWRLTPGELLSLLRNKDLWGHIRHDVSEMFVLSSFLEL